MKETDRDSTKRMQRAKMRDDMRYEEYTNSVNAKATECFRRKPYHLSGTVRQQGNHYHSHINRRESEKHEDKISRYHQEVMC